MSSHLKRGMNAAYRMLAYRDRSILEIRSALKKKDFEPATIEEVIGELTRKGYLDDKKFASVYGQSLARRKNVGPNYVNMRLLEKGVAGGTALEATDKIFENHKAMDETINRWIEKKVGKTKKNITPVQKKKKVYDFLLRKGFSHSDIFRALDRWNF